MTARGNKGDGLCAQVRLRHQQEQSTLQQQLQLANNLSPEQRQAMVQQLWHRQAQEAALVQHQFQQVAPALSAASSAASEVAAPARGTGDAAPAPALTVSGSLEGRSGTCG